MNRIVHLSNLGVLGWILAYLLLILVGCSGERSTAPQLDAHIQTADQSMSLPDASLADQSMIQPDVNLADDMANDTPPDTDVIDGEAPDLGTDATIEDATLASDGSLPVLDMARALDTSVQDPDIDGDGVSAQQGDCDDNDPLRAPGFVDVMEDGIDQDCDGYDLHSCTDNERYEPMIIQGWRTCVARSLDQTPSLRSAVQTHLSGDLSFIEEIMPTHALMSLRAVRIWVEEAVTAWPGAVYHPSPQWLINNGYPHYWARGVQIGNAANYLDWTNTQPAMVLHELSHAWHHQVVGYNEPNIIAAYEAAMSSGIYESVQYVGGGMQRAYATSNVQEYFAELTEAYFWTNDFYPFNRDELENFDPLGARTIEDGWGLSPE